MTGEDRGTYCCAVRNCLEDGVVRESDGVNECRLNDAQTCGTVPFRAVVMMM